MNGTFIQLEPDTKRPSSRRCEPLDLGPGFERFADDLAREWPLLGRSQRCRRIRSMGIAMARACGLDLIEVAASAVDSCYLPSAIGDASAVFRAIRDGS